jgi:predicted Zn-dependent peptidase
MYQKVVLDNGLRLITVEMPATKTVTVLVMVECGSKYEIKEINGISHFLEHMCFKGTKKRPLPKDVAETIDRLGGQNNAFTSKEFTGYWAKVDAKHTEVALDFVSDIFLNAKIELQEVEKERKVITEELNMYEDLPGRKVAEMFEEILYGDQPAGWDVGGTKETVAKIQKDQITDYRQKYYRSAGTIICVAGNIKPKEVLRKVKYLFGRSRTGKGPDKLRVVEEQTSPAAKVAYKKIDQTHLALGVRTFDVHHPDRYVAEMIAVILGAGMSSRLFQTIREAHSLAYYVRAYADFETDSGSLAAFAGVDNVRYELAIKEILRELKLLKKETVPEVELRKAKDLFMGRLMLNLESSDELASFYAGQEVLTSEILTAEEVRKRVEAVTALDIKRVAKEIFKPEKLNLAIIGPFKAPRQMNEEIVRILKI